MASNDSGDIEEIVFTLNEGLTHIYRYDGSKKSIFFIINENEIENKYITLCDNIDICEFSLKGNNNVETKITINEIVYNNNFKIEI